MKKMNCRIKKNTIYFIQKNLNIYCIVIKTTLDVLEIESIIKIYVNQVDENIKVKK
ncbi:hypothetical protein MTP04_03310 [Lysinibacillus sp. PLM2]|nr:hypothetical protein MTP04_03310 [Lysinibacillus sp. PLM2]